MDLHATTSPAAASNAVDSKTFDAERVQLQRLSHEFEAMFMSEMLRGMRDSFLGDEQDEGLGNATMTDTFDAELGQSLSKAGGLGLARMMLEALVKRGTDASAATVPVAPHVVAAYTSNSTTAAAAGSGTPPTAYAVPVAVPPALAPMPLVATTGDAQTPRAAVGLPGKVTSPFGWRPDPFTGRPQFHAGTDVRMAYGQGVQAVAGGRVSSVSERSGYGLTVVIDHGNGLETRYAHLSGASVREGDRVEAGQVVAQSGNSGRSTAPHLHLEARQNGKAIEMASLLKGSGVAADSYADRSYVRSSHED
jgi:murein DD-endopeptidase MepM/ murein hydrolase activator NlpD